MMINRRKKWWSSNEKKMSTVVRKRSNWISNLWIYIWIYFLYQCSNQWEKKHIEIFFSFWFLIDDVLCFVFFHNKEQRLVYKVWERKKKKCLTYKVILMNFLEKKHAFVCLTTTMWPIFYNFFPLKKDIFLFFFCHCDLIRIWIKSIEQPNKFFNFQLSLFFLYLKNFIRERKTFRFLQVNFIGRKKISRFFSFVNILFVVFFHVFQFSKQFEFQHYE